MKNYGERQDKNYDEILLKLINENNREVIRKTIKDYISQLES